MTARAIAPLHVDRADPAARHVGATTERDAHAVLADRAHVHGRRDLRCGGRRDCESGNPTITGALRPHLAFVTYVTRSIQAVRNQQSMAAPRGGSIGRTRALVEEGLTTRQIAERVDRCQTTVRHWLRQYGLKTKRPDVASSGEHTSSVMRDARSPNSSGGPGATTGVSVPSRAGRGSPAEGEEDAGGGGRRCLPHVRLRPVSRRAPLSSRRSRREGVHARGPWNHAFPHRDAARSSEVRAAVRELPCRGRGGLITATLD